jgi:hypothetical protein
MGFNSRFKGLNKAKNIYIDTVLLPFSRNCEKCAYVP